jgi:hypothetical protein
MDDPFRTSGRLEISPARRDIRDSWVLRVLDTSKSAMTSWSEGDDEADYASIHVTVLSRGDDESGAPVLCTGPLKSIPTLYELTLSTGSTHYVAKKRSDPLSWHPEEGSPCAS